MQDATLSADTIRTKLTTDQVWLERAVVAIFQMQTADEQATNSTRKRNNIGFNGADAHIGSYMAKWILKGNHLSGKFLAKAREMMPKYSGQLLEIARMKADACDARRAS